MGVWTDWTKEHWLKEVCINKILELIIDPSSWGWGGTINEQTNTTSVLGVNIDQNVCLNESSHKDNEAKAGFSVHIPKSHYEKDIIVSHVICLISWIRHLFDFYTKMKYRAMSFS